MSKIYLGADHRGFELKEKIKEYLESESLEYEDMGNTEYDKDDDYPDYATAVAEKVVGENGQGILICGSGQGICIAANKFDGVRAAVGFNKDVIKSSMSDEDVNVLCLSADHTKEREALKIIKNWLNTKFSGEERHVRRVNKIKEIEKKN